MRTYENINLAFAKRSQRTYLLLFGAESREQFNSNGISPDSVEKCIKMLLGENGCRYENGDLFVVHDSLKSSTYGHFGFSKANVSAYKPVHR